MGRFPPEWSGIPKGTYRCPHLASTSNQNSTFGSCPPLFVVSIHAPVSPHTDAHCDLARTSDPACFNVPTLPCFNVPTLPPHCPKAIRVSRTSPKVLDYLRMPQDFDQALGGQGHGTRNMTTTMLPSDCFGAVSLRLGYPPCDLAIPANRLTATTVKVYRFRCRKSA